MHKAIKGILHYAESTTAQTLDEDAKIVARNRIENWYRLLIKNNATRGTFVESDFRQAASALKGYALMSLGCEERGSRTNVEIADGAVNAAKWLDTMVNRRKAIDSD